MTEVSFFVPGVPVPQGSKNLSRYGIMYEANAKTKPWRAKVTLHAKKYAGIFTKQTPLHVTYIFGVGRPKTVKRRFPSVRPDIDKLQRAINDSITDAGVWGDDGQIVAVTALKEYTDEPGVRVIIKEIEE